MANTLQSAESFNNYSRYENNADVVPAKGRRPPNFVSYLCLYESDLYRINELKSRFDTPHVFVANYSDRFCINITRKGFFTYKAFKQRSEEYANRILVEKPGCEFRFVQEEPGEGGCTIFSFTETGYNLIRQRVPAKGLSFFTDPDWFSTILDANAPADYLHHRILHLLRSPYQDAFEIDCLVMELVAAVTDRVLNEHPLHQAPFNVRRHHLKTIERAKEFLLEHFAQPVSLHELSRHCYVSEFHFTRIFKKMCGYSPFEYLQQLRMKNAEVLLTNTDLPIEDVAFQSGFTRADYFSDAFSRKTGLSPRKFRLAVIR